ncbi:hypothetical protein [Humisphaera borealis]|uniref:Uncharacterized protein n=1 Tax=Humisphaera borealis TaxID=2807512 RepID=A0A7M2WPL4_9BACT|nr:hypothetical protein [Humisphaera borealis]QOV87353.1 hypothetical protein IPV69_13745 [Humisphaera borealis]
MNRNSWNRGLATALLLALVLPHGAATGDAKENLAKRIKWQNIVQFYGQEDTNLFSLAIYDRDAKEEANFQFKEIWKYDRDKKEWVKMDAAPRVVKVQLASQRNKAEGPVDAQILINLPIKIQDVGLYYAKWSIDDVACATYTFLGTRARDRTVPGKPKPGYKVEDVPVSIDKSELQIIPDPSYFTGEGSLPLPKK